jgi:hypothetical protein
MKTYTPQRNGVAERVVAFFRDNPDEELTRADIVAKFDCKAASVDVMLRPAVDAGLLAKHRERGRHMVWRSSTQPEPIPQLRANGGAAPNGHEAGIPIIAFAHERKSVLRGPFPVPSPTKLRIALWSDGALVIERGDTLVASLTADETRHLIKYLDKVLLDRVEDAAA